VQEAGAESRKAAWPAASLARRGGQSRLKLPRRKFLPRALELLEMAKIVEFARKLPPNRAPARLDGVARGAGEEGLNHQVVSFKSPPDTPRMPGMLRNPRLLCSGTRSSNPSPSSAESGANSTPRLRRPASCEPRVRTADSHFGLRTNVGDQRFESRFLQRRARANLIAPRPGWCRISRLRDTSEPALDLRQSASG
jgi:hypothetical protein